MQSLGVYVINLDDSVDRLQSIAGQLARLDIAFTRVPAVDGRKMTPAARSDYDAARASRYMGRSLVGGEIGCYLSHLRTAQAFLASGHSHALVLEDDALPLVHPIELLSRILPDLEVADPDWLLLNIGNDRLKIATSVATYDLGGAKRSLMAAHYFPMTTSAIVWSRRGAGRFVEEHSVMFAPVDNFFRYWLTRTGHGYSVWPPPVATIGAASEIADGRMRSYGTSGRSWHYGLAKQYRLFGDKLIAHLSKLRFRALSRVSRHPTEIHPGPRHSGVPVSLGMDAGVDQKRLLADVDVTSPPSPPLRSAPPSPRPRR